MDNIGFLGMKGLIDLRVAHILAQQTALQHKAALYQSGVAQHEADNAGWYTARADALEEAYKAQTYDPDDPTRNVPPAFLPPASTVRYSPWSVSHLAKGKADPTTINIVRRPVISSLGENLSLIAPFCKGRVARFSDFI